MKFPALKFPALKLPSLKPKPMAPLSEALEDHSAEGIGILTAVPWRFTQALVYAMACISSGLGKNCSCYRG